MRISDWSSDVCSSDLRTASACGVSHPHGHARHACPPSLIHHQEKSMALMFPRLARNFIRNGYFPTDEPTLERALRSEEHTSELQSLMRISYAVFCLKKKTQKKTNHNKKTTIIRN